MRTEYDRQQPSGTGTLIWALFFFLIFAFLIVGGVRWAGISRGSDGERATLRTKAREDRARDDREKLTGVGWVDQAGGIVRVPIADAKRAILTDLQTKKPAPSQVKVEPALPMSAPPADAAEAPMPALPSAPQGADTLAFAAFAPAAPAAPAAPETAPAPAQTAPPVEGNTPTPTTVPAPNPAIIATPGSAPAKVPVAPAAAPAATGVPAGGTPAIPPASAPAPPAPADSNSVPIAPLARAAQPPAKSADTPDPGRPPLIDGAGNSTPLK